jgi:hypothetical protein
MNTAGAAVITFSVEVITLPVSDVDRALRFYVDRVGFTLDVDYAPSDAFRVVQLTPPGSGCSIQIGNGLTNAPAGSIRSIYLVVTDPEAARSRLLERGIEVSPIRHKVPIDTEALQLGSTQRTGTTRASPTSRTRMAILECCRNEVTASRKYCRSPQVDRELVYRTSVSIIIGRRARASFMPGTSGLMKEGEGNQDQAHAQHRHEIPGE